MYRCQRCGCVVGPRTPACRLVVRTRPKQYPFRPWANTVIRVQKDGKRRKVKIPDPGGVGTETVKEIVVCPACRSTARK